MVPIIATFNHKGGVAKTSLTVNLMCVAAKPGSPVLLVDADMQGTAARSLRVDPNAPGLYELLHGQAPLKDCLHEAPEHPGLWVIPPGEGLGLLGQPRKEDEAESEHKIAATEYAARLTVAIQSAGDLLAAPLKFALIDLPPSFSIVTSLALLASRRILVPMTPSQESVDAIAALLAEIKRKRVFNPGLQILGVVVTMYQKNADQETYIRKFREILPVEIAMFDTIIPRNQAVSTATSFCKPVVVYDKTGRGAAAYRRLYGEFEAGIEREFHHGA